MALVRRRKAVTSEIPTASMADIAFLLLIFFLTSTVFDEEKGLDIVLPEPASEVAVAEGNVLHLLVQANGEVHVRQGDEGEVQRIRSEQVADAWRSAVRRNPNLIAAVQTSPAAPYRYMVDVLDQLRLAGADRISLQPLEE